MPPPFIGSRRGGVHAWNVLGFVTLFPNRGEQLAVAVAEHCEAWGAVDYAWDVSIILCLREHHGLVGPQKDMADWEAEVSKKLVNV